MNGPADKPYQVPKGVECPRCKQVMQFAQDVTPGASNHFHKGKIVVCSKCALATIVGDSKLIPLSLQQIKNLPPLLRNQLLAVCRKVAENVTRNN